ncbi:UNVERIFIED_CONTAM: hypothetical protein Sindi_1655800 [Sesamum indicum]
MIEGFSVQRHGVKMLSFVEKLEDLKVGLNNDTYIDVILQSLLPSYDPFIIIYNMNGLEKSIHELINMLVEDEAMTHKSALMVLIGQASTSRRKERGPEAKRGKRKKKKLSHPLLAPLLLQWERTKGKERMVVHSSRGQIMFAFITVKRGIGRGSAHNSSSTQALERSKRLHKDEMILRFGDGNIIAAEAVISQ